MLDLNIIFLAAGEGDGGGNGNLMFILMMVAMVGIFYFMIIRPQGKQRKEHETMISALQEGDDVQTIGGIYGSITRIKQKTVYLRISDKVEIEILKSAIAGKQKGTGE